MMSSDRYGEDGRFRMTNTETPRETGTANRSANCLIVEDHGAATSEAMNDVLRNAVAELRGIDRTGLEPLFDTLDFEAIDHLFDSNGPFIDRHAALTFEYGGCLITIRPGAEILIECHDD